MGRRSIAPVIFDYLKRYIDEHGQPPASATAIADRLGVSNVSVWKHLDDMRERNLIDMPCGTVRSLRLLKTAYEPSRRVATVAPAVALRKSPDLCAARSCFAPRAPESQWCDWHEEQFIARYWKDDAG